MFGNAAQVARWWFSLEKMLTCASGKQQEKLQFGGFGGEAGGGGVTVCSSKSRAGWRGDVMWEEGRSSLGCTI